MKTRDLIKLSTRMFTARRGRTLLTILGMGIGFAAILFLVSLGYGLQDALLSTITSSGALSTLDVSAGESDGSVLDKKAVEEIAMNKSVLKIETGYEFNARLKYEGSVSDARSVVATPGFIDLEGIKVAKGKMISDENPKEVLISSAFGKIVEKSPEELIGKNVSFLLFYPTDDDSGKTENVEIEGYIISGVVENEEPVFYVNVKGIDVPGGVRFSKLKVQCKASDMMASVKEDISQRGYSVSSLSETVAEVNKLFRIINFVLGLFGIVTLSVSAIGMFNTMTVALLERTREIGIMRSIGASRMDIMMMFIIESTLMGIFGGVTGIVLGLISSQLVNFLVNTAAKYFGGRTIDLFAYPIWFLGFVLLFSIIIGVATGIGPAKRASSLDPLEALRTR